MQKGGSLVKNGCKREDPQLCPVCKSFCNWGVQHVQLHGPVASISVNCVFCDKGRQFKK